MDEQIKTLIELIENCSHTAQLLIKSEIALNDGAVDCCQKCISQAQGVMSVMVKDVFVETSEQLNLSDEDSADYDLPNALELSKQLSEIIYNASILLTMLRENESENILNISKKKLSAHLSAATEIYNSLFNN